eukprot:CAMPEP_0205800484 /NCGR_PEP_ID=MMETSP0205-20121125/2137_1 /ASSEMBLY_ACC=CAM_ASM_000278 /TAXON_ID=36767 /ORGANISM="Euplotes focardii, Strain TN1" /LENGTH=102 /DNA_ID=CAMNT_0053063607 /DNA_START=702 /DNA_END=1010 /DNA_ORIENTATION=+
MQKEMKAVKYRVEINDEDFDLTFIQDLPEILAEKLSSCDYYKDEDFSLKEFKQRLKKKKQIISNQRKHLESWQIAGEFDKIHTEEDEKEGKEEKTVKRRGIF